MSNYQEKATLSGHTFDKLKLGLDFHQSAHYDVKQANDQAVRAVCRKSGVARAYTAVVNFTDSNLSGCTCGYYLNYKNGGTVNRTELCSHQIGMLIHCDNGQVTVEPPPEGTRVARQPRAQRATVNGVSIPSQPGQYSFKTKMSNRIDSAITETSNIVLEKLDAGMIPIMVGPTGCGKTSAVKKLLRVLADRGEMWGLETIGGLETYGDADLFGIRMINGDIEGVISRAFRRALSGENILLFIDELLRFDTRVQNAFMLALQPIDVDTAHAMGIATDEPVYVTEAPIWGRVYAPCSRIKWIFGCNPWGAKVDPAFGRRTQPVFVGYSKKVLDLIDDEELNTMINSTWEGVKSDSIQLPIEYQQLAAMKNGHDRSIIPNYLDRLRFVDEHQFQMALTWLPEIEREQYAAESIM